MPENNEDVIRYRCPLCLMKDEESFPLYDAERKLYRCQFCAFEGGEDEILGYYRMLTGRYKLLDRRLRIEPLGREA